MNGTNVLSIDSKNESYYFTDYSKERLFNHLKALWGKRDDLKYDLKCHPPTSTKSKRELNLRTIESCIYQIQSLIISRILKSEYDFNSVKEDLQGYDTFLSRSESLSPVRRAIEERVIEERRRAEFQRIKKERISERKRLISTYVWRITFYALFLGLLFMTFIYPFIH